MRRTMRVGAIGLLLALACAGLPERVRAEPESKEPDARLKAVIGDWVFVADRSTGPGQESRP